MKRFFILTAVACAASAQADLVLQQQIVTPDYNGTITMKVKGDKVRLDVNTSQSQALGTIMDLNTGETITLIPAQKLFLKTMGGPVNKPQTSGGVVAPGPKSNAPVPHATGKTQKVGEYDTELYAWSSSGGITGTAWVAKSFPDYARIRADLAILDKTTGADNGASPELSTLPGMVVRSEVSGGGKTITMALISAKEGPLDNSFFGVPYGYKELPKLQPLKTVGAQPAANSATAAPVPASRTITPSTQKAPAW